MKKETAQKLLELSENEYNTYAREFSDTRPFFWRELEFLKRYAKMEYSILDIGCGNGRILDLFGNKNIHYTGIDSSKELIEIALKQRGDKGDFIHANALDLPFQNESFDTIFSIAVLHHVPSKKFRNKFISETHRVLKHGGTFVFTVWNILQWNFFKTHVIHILKKLFNKSDMDFGDTILTFGQQKRERYIHAFTKHGIKKLLNKHGFSISSLKEVKRRSGYANFVVVAKKN